MRHLLAVVFIVLLVALPSCNYFKKRKLFGNKDNISVAWQAQQDSIRVADSIKKVQESLLATKSAWLDSVRKADQVRLNMESKYSIIVGSFITPQYAKEYAEVYKKQGYNARIIKMAGSRFELVAAESHDNLGEAVSRLKEFQDTVQIESWIYNRK